MFVAVPCIQVDWLFRSMIVLSVCVVVSQIRLIVVLLIVVAVRLIGGCGM